MLSRSLAEANGRAERLEGALKPLVEKLDAIELHGGANSAFRVAAIHGFEYEGPKYADELKEARAALTTQSKELACYGCGRPYERGPDLVVSDADWERIKPPEGSSQVMCPNCMNDAFEAIGAPYGSVEAAFTSGPLANRNWKKPRPKQGVNR